MSRVNIAAWWWWCDGVGVGFMTHIGSLDKVEQHLNPTEYLNIITNQVHPFMAALYLCIYQCIYLHATRLGLSRNGSMNMTVNSAYCSVLPGHQISIQLIICGMRWNELFGEEIHYQTT
jgi:hypothetical protein